MIAAIRDHVELRGDDPLAAAIAGTHYKACLVANLALNDGSQAAADHYRLELAAVHGAMAFYYDNEAAIHEAIRQARELGEKLDARSVQAALEELRARNCAHKRHNIDLSLDTMRHWRRIDICIVPRDIFVQAVSVGFEARQRINGCPHQLQVRRGFPATPDAPDAPLPPLPDASLRGCRR